MFLLSKTEIRRLYLEGHPSLTGRVMFTASNPGDSDAAFLVLPDSKDPKISEAVWRGYLVFTRADIDTEEARTGAVERRDAAFESGAQLISTDYPSGEPSPWANYSVRFSSGAVARCNPVNVRASCNISAPTTPPHN